MTAQTDLEPEVEAMYVAQCVTCLLTDKAVCPACCFNIGLALRTVNRNTLSLPLEKREEYWKMLPRDLWEAYANYLQH